MKSILVIDDIPENIEVLAGFLCNDHDVAFALSGEEGLALVGRQPVDVILLDVMMPGMNGFEVLARLRENPATRDIPVIMVTAKTDAASESAALGAGAVDFIHKPINADVVRARVGVQLRLRAQAAAIDEKSRCLQQSLDQQEAEHALARDVLLRHMRLAQAPLTPDRYWFSPATLFSGDVFSVARAPDGRIVALIADATGHGLAAAITTMPLLTSFHEQVARAGNLQHILAMANTAMCANLPPGRFVAAALVAIDPAHRTAQVWNGGMPEGLLLDANGEVVRRFVSTDLPLGVGLQQEGEFRVEEIALADGGQFFLYSDGIPTGFRRRPARRARHSGRHGSKNYCGASRLRSASDGYAKASANISAKPSPMTT